MKVKMEDIQKTLTTVVSREEVISHGMEDTKKHDADDTLHRDHEDRLRFIEKNVFRYIGTSSVLAALGAAALSLVVAYVIHLIG